MLCSTPLSFEGGAGTAQGRFGCDLGWSRVRRRVRFRVFLRGGGGCACVHVSVCIHGASVQRTCVCSSRSSALVS